jgi:cbb3-type cytochrome oxidase subunit 1
MDGRPFIDSVIANRPWYMLRAAGGGLMTLGHVVFAWNLWLMRARPHRRTVAVAVPTPLPEPAR